MFDSESLHCVNTLYAASVMSSLLFCNALLTIVPSTFRPTVASVRSLLGDVISLDRSTNFLSVSSGAAGISVKCSKSKRKQKKRSTRKIFSFSLHSNSRIFRTEDNSLTKGWNFSFHSSLIHRLLQISNIRRIPKLCTLIWLTPVFYVTVTGSASTTLLFRIEFYRIYRIYRICRKLFLVVSKIESTKNSLLQNLYIL